MIRLILIFLFFSQCIFASFDMNENIQRSYSYILNLEFKKSTLLLAKEQAVNPKNGFILLHENYIDFLTILINEEVDYFESHKKFKDIRLDLIDDNDISSPYYLYSKAEIYLQWAFSRLKFEQYATAAYEFVKAYKLLQQNHKKFPEFSLNKKGLGLIHALLGAVPEDFHWILKLAGLEGGVDRGLSELDVVLNDNRFSMYEDEVLFLLSFLQINLGNNDVFCQKYLDRIGERYQDNSLLNFAAARLSYNLGQNDYCLKVLQNRPNNKNRFEFYYLDYLEGLAYLYMLDLKNARNKFEYFLDNFNGVNYVKSANHKLAWIAFLERNRNSQLIYFDRVISDGVAVIDEDKAALRDAMSSYISHPLLLKARLLYDGGYYTLALSELSQIQENQHLSFLTDDDEYWYRLARIGSRLEKSNKIIIEQYQAAFQKGQGSTNYYAPMSALQIALIYENEDDFQQAELYFNKCLKMSSFDYERGIHQKAKLGLERISN